VRVVQYCTAAEVIEEVNYPELQSFETTTTQQQRLLDKWRPVATLSAIITAYIAITFAL
jgi:hypothetical protein